MISIDNYVPIPPCRPKTTSYTVGPLLTTTWGQACSYNDLCPNKSCKDVCYSSSNAYTGCVATAIAQIVRYWQPVNSYHYNYASMPTDHGDYEVARLMRDAGQTVSMTYGCYADGGSSAYGSDVPSALKRNFGFSSANRSGFNISTVNNNITIYKYPVLLEGCSTRHSHLGGLWYTYENCHEWVCDGSQTVTFTDCDYGISYGFLHMNWGWHELYSTSGSVGLNPDYNGWFAFDNWAPDAHNFQYAQDMVTEIHP